MSYTASNASMGPADVYVGVHGATLPTEGEVNTAPAASAWTHVGYTQGGVTLKVKMDFEDLEADQSIDPIGGVPTSREVTLTMELAETTLANLTLALNGGTTTTGAGADVYSPTAGSDTSSTYKAVIVDAKQGTGTVYRRRYILRRVLPTEGIEVKHTKKDQVTYSVTMKAYSDEPNRPYEIHSGVVALS